MIGSNVFDNMQPGDMIKFVTRRFGRTIPSLAAASATEFKPGTIGIVVSVINHSEYGYREKHAFIVASSATTGWIRLNFSPFDGSIVHV